MKLIGILSYTFDNLYTFTGTIRRDYAGLLHVGKKYVDFPSVTLGWKISEESFILKIKNINLIKIRGDFGQINNLSSVIWAYVAHTSPSIGYFRLGWHVLNFGGGIEENGNAYIRQLIVT
ncbi:MAG: hypothetical protein LBH32_03705 [Dysgonamonadaceae bacterium]|jgi:hypothetical protein|nr:hypothetical protein [Dysgonamonadaceae bacterium]